MKKKKLLTILLIFAVGTGAFAQFTWRLDADFNIRLLSWMLPTGEKAEKFIQVGEEKKFNNTNADNNPTSNNRGDYSYSSGAFDLFSYNRITFMRENELRLDLDYRSRNQAVALHTTTYLDELVRATVAANQGTGADEWGGGHSFVQGNGRSPNWGDFLRNSFGEWYIRGNFTFLSAYVGNTYDQGKVRLFNNINADVLRSVLVSEGVGVNTPTASANYQNGGQDINNLSRSLNITENSNYNFSNRVYLMTAVRITEFSFPLTFQIAADPGNNTLTSAKFNYRKFSGAVRVSGENVFDRITFDAIYKFRGGDDNTLDNYDPEHNPGGTLQPNGNGISAHSFGLFANILNVPDFSFMLGYSGYMRVFEDTLSKAGELTTRSGPLFSGFDVRVMYNGVKNTGIIFHNNISFANTGRSTADEVSVGLLGLPLPYDPDVFTYQSWFALYNALGVNYRLDGQLTFSFQIANRYGIITTYASSSGGISEIKRSHFRLAGGGCAIFQFNRNLLLQAGVGLLWTNDSYSNNASNTQNTAATRDATGGALEIGIPIRMRVSFRP